MHGVQPKLLLMSLTLWTAACGASTGRTTRVGNTSVISTAEIDASGYSDVFSLVRSMRPNWLRARGVNSVASPEVVKVYLDGSLLGGPDYLRQIATTSISSIQYLDGLEATQRWGLDHGAGALLISTRGRPIDRQE